MNDLSELQTGIPSILPYADCLPCCAEMRQVDQNQSLSLWTFSKTQFDWEATHCRRRALIQSRSNINSPVMIKRRKLPYQPISIL